jgi:5-methylcytosine-specific restriction protein A
MALSEKGYACENDKTHVTFIGIRGHTFMEAHHLVPIEFQDDFKVSIDVPENILCLCPTCHRSFHNSEVNLRKQLVSQFFNSSNFGLKNRGINITKNQLLKYYIK